MTDNEPHMTGRLRTVVRLADVLAEDLSRDGTASERGVAILLAHVATCIVNGDAEMAAKWLRIAGLGEKPRADKVAQAHEAATVAEDRLDLPDSYSGIG